MSKTNEPTQSCWVDLVIILPIQSNFTKRNSENLPNKTKKLRETAIQQQTNPHKKVDLREFLRGHIPNPWIKNPTFKYLPKVPKQNQQEISTENTKNKIKRIKKNSYKEHLWTGKRGQNCDTKSPSQSSKYWKQSQQSTETSPIQLSKAST
ncbi:hypothetical protein F511_38749 [Dorcoceras hygrometricum]|uniref:Uncharacterized protein n=1 Tax=Dorcoceras hygrometricum TaxID=472368 RepID=A0A2Z7AYB6_9LAMI|nr:hypothetical protein F511_38749 [Dorcoceras hygrometricum]